MYEVDWWLTVGDERRLLFLMSCVMILCALALFAVLLVMPAPYGRYSSSSWGWLLDCHYAWFIQELPWLLLPVVLWLRSADVKLPNKLLLGAFVVHYIHRSLLYPALIRNGKPVPVSVFLIASVLSIYNGFLQSRYLLMFAVYPATWVTSTTFLSGALLFTVGMVVNIHSDHSLLSLRQATDTKDVTYKIPHGGLFEYVSCANYLGELVEWLGFAVASWSLPGLAFALLTLCNLVPRALQHHRWYVRKFEDYPITRKALIPFVL